MGFLPALRQTIIRGGANSGSELIPLSSIVPIMNPTTTHHHKIVSVVFMALAMSLHFFGYEFARSATLTLFTSSKTGFTSSISLPLALACVCPASLTLLYVYTACLDKFGPSVALRYTSLLCVSILASFAAIVNSWSKLGLSKQTVKYLVGVLFVFREAYVQLLSTQYWSFIGSVLTKQEVSERSERIELIRQKTNKFVWHLLRSAQGATWFAPIAGVSSLSSALAGYCLGPMVTRWGLSPLLLTSALSILCSLFFAERAYSMSTKHGFNPCDEHAKHKVDETMKRKKTKAPRKPLITKVSE